MVSAIMTGPRLCTLLTLQVAQLGGMVSEFAAYHHGDAALHGCIINMAQDFVGSNNINLLSPRGMFGTRLQVRAVGNSTTCIRPCTGQRVPLPRCQVGRPFPCCSAAQLNPVLTCTRVDDERETACVI